MKCKLAFILCALLCGWIAAAQGQIVVSGLVTDSSSGDPLSFVSVYVKNDKVGVLSDDKGRYSIKVNVGDTLRFTYLGYRNYEFIVQQAGIKDVALVADYFDGPEWFPSHASMGMLGVAGVYTGESWGYQVEYMYSPGWNYPRNGVQRAVNSLSVGLRLTDVDPGDPFVKFYPHVRANLGWLVEKWTRRGTLIYPFVDAGYYMDTDFSTVRRQGFGFGAGVNIPKLGFPFQVWPGVRLRSNLTVGWAGYAGQGHDNYFYLGLRFYRRRIYFIE